MREYFASPNEDRRLQDEWANLKQYGTIFEYVSVLTALIMRIPGLSQIQILDKFIHGLKSKIRIEVDLRDSKTSDEAYRLADHLIELFTAQGTPVFSHKTTIVMHQHRARARMRTTTNLCRSIPYDPVDSDQETFSDLKVFSNLAIKDPALRTESQGTSQ